MSARGCGLRGDKPGSSPKSRLRTELDGVSKLRFLRIKEPIRSLDPYQFWVCATKLATSDKSNGPIEHIRLRLLEGRPQAGVRGLQVQVGSHQTHHFDVDVSLSSNV